MCPQGYALFASSREDLLPCFTLQDPALIPWLTSRSLLPSSKPAVLTSFLLSNFHFSPYISVTQSLLHPSYWESCDYNALTWIIQNNLPF